MHICTKCNQPVPAPVDNKCPQGHLLYDPHLLGATSERSFFASFLSTLMICVLVLAATAVAGAVWRKSATAWAGYALVTIIVVGILVLLRGFKWQRQGGAAARLVPRAMGMAVACILAGGALFAAGIALSVIH